MIAEKIKQLNKAQRQNFLRKRIKQLDEIELELEFLQEALEKKEDAVKVSHAAQCLQEAVWDLAEIEEKNESDALREALTPPSKEAIEKNEKRLEDSRKVFK